MLPTLISWYVNDSYPSRDTDIIIYSPSTQSDLKNIRRVVLMNKAGDALVTGSGWIADGMIKGGNALARKITV